MALLYVNEIEAEDLWINVEGDQPLPLGENLIVSVDYLSEHRSALLERENGQFGVRLEAGEQVEAIADILDHLALVALDFPTFADGRSFSKARTLRDKYGFKGQIRAVGDVRIDQLNHMKRCGIDALLISHQPTISALSSAQDPSIQLYYQPALGDAVSSNGRHWARRANTQE